MKGFGPGQQDYSGDSYVEEHLVAQPDPSRLYAHMRFGRGREEWGGCSLIC